VSVHHLGKCLHKLSYSEMQVVARKLAPELGLDPTAIADALAAVGAALVADPNAGEELETKHLQAVFSRKRALSVQLVNRNFVVTLNTSNMQSVSPSLSTALAQLVDNVVATQAMGLKP
jgi:hypothetical protein